jgi:hypothetical protein
LEISNLTFLSFCSLETTRISLRCGKQVCSRGLYDKN